MSTSEILRTFVAIELPDDIKRALGAVIDGLRDKSRAPARWVSPNAIHLTLKFLGETPASRLDEVKGALESACAGTPPMQLHLGSPGCFPTGEQPRVVWVGVDGDLKVLSTLATRIDIALAKSGYDRESRRFVPHLTIARVRPEASRTTKRDLGAIVAAAAPPARLQFSAEAVSLMRSQLRPEGAIYTRLSSVPLLPQ